MSTSDEDTGQRILKHPKPLEKTKSKESPTWLDILPQIISACAAHTLVMQVGIHMTYSTVQIPQLHLNPEQSSWLAGLVTITNPIGALCIGPIMDKIGRKWSLLLVCVPFIMSYIVNIVSSVTDIELHYLSKICAGVGSGMSTVAMVYVSEICHGDYRPALLCLNSVFISFGILLTSLLNLYFNWKALSICFLALILLSGVLLVCIAPESPHWLINLDKAHGDSVRISKAEKSLKYLNPSKELFEKEWRVLNQVRITHNTSNTEGSLLKKIVTTKQCYKPLIILLILFSLQQLTGVYPVIFYALQLFKEVGTDFGAGINESDALVFLAVIRFAMSVATAVLARGFGRKPLLLISTAGICLFSLLLSMNLLIKSTHENCSVYSDSTNWNETLTHSIRVNSSIPNHDNRLHDDKVHLKFDQELNTTTSSLSSYHSSHLNSNTSKLGHTPHHQLNVSCSLPQYTLHSDRLSLLFILLYVCFSAVGVIVIPWTMIGELLPSYARGTCSGLLISYGYVWMFIMVKMFPAALQYSVIGTFNMFGVISLALVVFVYFYLPETKGKTFVEIESYFS